MNFIMKFLEKRFVKKREFEETEEEFVGIADSLDRRLTRIFNKTDELVTSVNDLNKRMADLEEGRILTQVITGEVRVGGRLSKQSATNALIDILENQKGEKLHYSDIYSKIKRYNLANPNVTIQSVKAILYQLARQNRIVLDNGTETGMFFIEKK